MERNFKDGIMKLIAVEQRAMQIPKRLSRFILQGATPSWTSWIQFRFAYATYRGLTRLPENSQGSKAVLSGSKATLFMDRNPHFSGIESCTRHGSKAALFRNLKLHSSWIETYQGSKAPLLRIDSCTRHGSKAALVMDRNRSGISSCTFRDRKLHLSWIETYQGSKAAPFRDRKLHSSEFWKSKGFAVLKIGFFEKNDFVHSKTQVLKRNYTPLLII